MKKNERFADFALRLQTTYEAATTNDQRDVEVLKKQFLNCLPRKVARRFKVRMGGEKEGAKVRWKEVVNWAQEEDELDDQEEPETTAIPIWATLRDDGGERMPVQYGRPHAASSGPRDHDNRNRPYHDGIARCHHCGKRGHIKRDCWKLRGWCLVCGSSDHKHFNCEMRAGNRYRRRQTGQEDEENQGRNGTRVYDAEERRCFLCDEVGHFRESCPMKAQVEELIRKNRQTSSGNEAAPPLPGVSRSQQQQQ